MHSTKHEATGFLITALIITEALLVMIQPILSGMLQSLVIYALWAETIALIGVTVSNNKSEMHADVIYIFLLIIVFGFSLLTGRGNRSAAIIGFLEFFVMLSPFYWIEYVTITEKQIETAKKIAVAKAIFFIFLSFTSKGYAPYYANGIAVIDGSLTLGYSNPNLTGIYIVNTMGVLLYFSGKSRVDNKHINRLTLVLAIALGYLAVRTQSRATLICVVFLGAVFLAGHFKRVKIVVTSNITLAVFMALPLVFVYIFYHMYRTAGTYLFMGADIFSRISIYNQVVASFENHKWIGDVMTWHFQNSHNGMLTILANLGVVGLVLYLVYMYKRIHVITVMFRERQTASILPYVAILTFFLHACVESATLTGGVLYAADVATVCMLCIYEATSDIGADEEEALTRMEDCDE